MGNNSIPTKVDTEQQHAGGRDAARAPKRSDSVPATGPETRNPAVSGSRKMPAHSGVWAKS